MAIGQKDAVIAEVMAHLPTFQKCVDNAILKLNNAQLEAIKMSITIGIQSGAIEYSKDVTNTAEVRTYARSMVMNHLKKAKELNGGFKIVPPQDTTISGYRTTRQKVVMAPKGVNPDLLPDELKEFVKTLV